MSLRISIAGRFAREAAAQGEGEVCAAFRRSFYLRFPGKRYACVGDATLGRGPLNVIVDDLQMPPIGERMSLSLAHAPLWAPPPALDVAVPDIGALQYAARGRAPREGLGSLVLDEHNALSGHAQPALDTIERWLVGNAIDHEAQGLIGLGPGLTPSGDDYLGGVLLALHYFARKAQAQGLWRWLEPRLGRTSDISAAHLAAAAAGEGHETLHLCLETLCTRRVDWPSVLDKLDQVGHCSGWDSLAGVVAVAKLS